MFDKLYFQTIPNALQRGIAIILNHASFQSRSLLTLYGIYAFALTLILVTIGCYPNPYKQGETLYMYYCSNCHMGDGSGLARLIPPLDSARLTLSDPAKLICLIRLGLPKNERTGQQMAGNTALTEVEMTNLVNYLGSKYASKPQAVKVDQVKKLLDGCQTD